jgi:hypothetical protein
MPAGVWKSVSSPREGTSGLPREGRLGFVVMMVEDHGLIEAEKKAEEGRKRKIFLQTAKQGGGARERENPRQRPAGTRGNNTCRQAISAAPRATG